MWNLSKIGNYANCILKIVIFDEDYQNSIIFLHGDRIYFNVLFILKATKKKKKKKKNSKNRDTL